MLDQSEGGEECFKGARSFFLTDTIRKKRNSRVKNIEIMRKGSFIGKAAIK